MYYIRKEDIEHYRLSIAKKVFLMVYKEYKFVEDIEKSNSIICYHSERRKQCIVSLFSIPDCEYDKNKDVYSFFLPQHYKKAFHKYNNNLIHVLEFSKAFVELYNDDFEKAITSPSDYLLRIKKSYLVLFEGLLLKRNDIKDFDKIWYKYYSKEKVENNKYNVVDGVISFSDPNEFNDPFDVNCFFANGSDMSSLYRIFCVSPSPREILSWSYYGSDHKGYCFGYKECDILDRIIDSKINGLCIIGHVNYTPKRPKQKSKLNNISFTEVDFYIKAAFTKYVEWEHEKEYRFVLLANSFDSDHNKYMTFNIPVQKIYAGCKGTGLPVYNTSGSSVPTHMINKDKNSYKLL